MIATHFSVAAQSYFYEMPPTKYRARQHPEWGAGQTIWHTRFFSSGGFSRESWYCSAMDERQVCSSYDGLRENNYEAARTIFRSRHKFAGV